MSPSRHHWPRLANQTHGSSTTRPWKDLWPWPRPWDDINRWDPQPESWSLLRDKKDKYSSSSINLEMKKSEIALTRMRHFAELGGKKAKELKEQDKSQAKEILKQKLQKVNHSIEIIDQKNIHLVPRSPSGPRLALRSDVSYLQIHNCDHSFCFI